MISAVKQGRARNNQPNISTKAPKSGGLQKCYKLQRRKTENKNEKSMGFTNSTKKVYRRHGMWTIRMMGCGESKRCKNRRYFAAEENKQCKNRRASAAL